MRIAALAPVAAAGLLMGCGGRSDGQASSFEQGGTVAETSSGPCYSETLPHSPQAVMAVFVTAGFEVSAECVDDETTIFAVPKDAGGSVGVVCSVVPGPDPSDEYDGAVIAGNVACGADTPAERAAARTILDGL
ncbi:MAG: hypothetical protein ACRDNB_04315 [Gaiellaceae bacterium]